GKVIMYADTITKSMKKAIDETNRRRKIQSEYNEEHNIIPKTIVKDIRDVIEATKVIEDEEEYVANKMSKDEMIEIIKGLESEMLKEAESLNFEKAAELRDKANELKKML
ncbi:UvrB/UvrC motif-containing protein, partial [Anaerosalibacter bizertensis]|nr:UvrB/UvrC motif-containing protein [Anaerosalibacter bizertensis]